MNRFLLSMLTIPCLLSAAVTDQLQLHYDFDESDGARVIDQSPNRNDATLGEKCLRVKMADPFQVQHFGYAIRMGSPVSGQRNPAVAISGKALTIEAWIKTDIQAKGYLVFTNAKSDWKTYYHGYSLEVNELNMFRLWLGFGDAIKAFDSKFELRPETFYHIIATYDGENVKFYVNGRMTDVFPENRAIVSNPGNDVFMGNFGAENSFLLDRIKIFNRCLTIDEINSEFEDDKAPNQYKSLAAGALSAATSPNLLLNSSFNRSANAHIPDWWGTFMQNSIREWGPDVFGIDETTAPPIPGVRCLRVANNALTENSFWLGSTFTNLPGERDYTFSVYLKAAAPGIKVSAGVFTGDEVWQPDQELTPTTQWQRFVVSGRRSGKTPMRSLNLQLKGVGVVWIAAPQLEFGLTASDYQPAAADQPDGNTADLPRLVSLTGAPAPVIDGKLDDPMWTRAEKWSNFQTNTMPPTSAAVQTVARIGSDEKNLYIALQCMEPELEKLTARAEGDDQSAIFEDDSVEIFLATDSNADDYYQLAVNSRGARLDACNQNNTWNADWTVKTGRGDGFWTAELAIPIAALNRSRMENVWRINLCRSRYVSGRAECSTLSPLNSTDFHTTKRFAFLSGLQLPTGNGDQPQPEIEYPQFSAFSEFDYYTGDDVAFLIVDTRLPGPMMLRIDVAKGDGTSVGSHESTLKSGFNQRIAIPVKELPAGKYRVKITALRDGAVVAACEDAFAKLPPAPVVQVRTNRAARHLEVDGKPFFGYGSAFVFYWVKYATGRSGEPFWQLDDMRDHHQNSMWLGDMGVQDYEKRYTEYETFLDGCAKRNLKVIFNIQCLPAPESAVLRDNIVRFVNRFKSHPAIIAWNFVDEPELWWDSSPGRREADLREVHDAIKAADPYRPAFINWCHFSERPYGSLAATDIVSVDRYPLRYEMLTFKPGIVLDIAAELNRVGRKQRLSSMLFLQLQGFWDMSREPSAAEFRQMSFLSFIHGTRIIQYLIYRCMSNDLWAEVGTLGAEFETLSGFVTAPGARELTTVANYKNLSYTIWKSGEEYLVVYANNSAGAISVRLDWKKLIGTSPASPEMFSGATGVTLSGDTFEFNLAPLQCGAFKIPAGTKI